MLGERQWETLETWLLDVKDRFPVKFLVSSCSLLFQMWIDFARDRWNGFPRERDRLLHFLAANGIEGVYLLTGDLHSTHAVKAELYGPGGQPLPLWEFCASPFEQDPNNLARRTYRPLSAGPVRDQQLYFVRERRNFGLVRVDFPGEAGTRVRFRVYGPSGELIGAAGSGG
jgi:phosphodiesterase/alkaline phosphatase D-like protein